MAITDKNFDNMMEYLKEHKQNIVDLPTIKRPYTKKITPSGTDNVPDENIQFIITIKDPLP